MTYALPTHFQTRSLMQRFSTLAMRTGVLSLLGAALWLGTPLAQTANATFSAGAKGTEGAIADGRYLYGESATPNQIGATYLVMEVNQGQVVGAIYMPNSSFDCFYGQLAGRDLDITIVNSYDQTAQPYQIALTQSGLIAGQNGATLPSAPEGMTALETLSTQDLAMLATCRTH
ncbi:MAG: hypothetical protein IGR92_02415 [Leptolyngbyaceae cyanobacterium T60_A2020_046]|nr:hypothetical protein [Leptolyngbyaceae cyanobacterium T60_A2020_046]